ncbi:MAG: hypothetical protein JST53_02880 [Actinobacteria bacterium]|nr:hypothetical protein [Actinomycetota bacterium]
MAVTGPDFVALQVRDLDRAARFYEARLGLRRAAGVTIPQPPSDGPFGRMFSFVGPDGYLLTIHGR